MKVSADDLRMRSTKSVTAFRLCTVAVGLFGLLKNTRPAPFAAAAIASRSSRKLESTLLSRTGCPSCLARLVGFSKVGSAVVNASAGDVNSITAFRRISCDPAPITTFSGLVPYLVAIVATRSRGSADSSMTTPSWAGRSLSGGSYSATIAPRAGPRSRPRVHQSHHTPNSPPTRTTVAAASATGEVEK